MGKQARRLGYSLTKRIIRRDGGSGNEARTDLGPLDCYFPRRRMGNTSRHPRGNQITAKFKLSFYRRRTGAVLIQIVAIAL
jgi:hypothetical protein